MLSKYTVVLLGLGTLTFLLLDARSRRWFLRPEPYLAAVIALVLFTPVLVWNMRQDWISFMFQGPDRLASSPKFSLHVLIGSVFLLLTPTALVGIAKVLLPQSVAKSLGSDQISAERRRYFWALSFTSVLLSVFVIYSLRHQVKLNWTAPVWLAGGQAALLLGDALATLKGYGYERAALPGVFAASAKLALATDRAIFACDDGVARVVTSAGTELDVKSDCLSPPVRGDGFFAIAESQGAVRLVYPNGVSNSLALGAAPLRPIWDAARRRLITSTATGSVTVLELPSEQP